MANLRVLICDDSRAFRSELADCIDRSGIARVVEHASSGEEALLKIVTAKPDLVTLDVEMPGLDGLETLAKLHQRHPKLPVLMISSHTSAGAETTVRALALGALDFVTKPQGIDRLHSKAELRAQLVPILRTMVGKESVSGVMENPLRRQTPLPHPIRGPGDFELVAIAASTGGPAALHRLIPALPRDFPLPLVLVQHMPELFTRALADSLAQKSQLRVVEATDGLRIEKGTLYLAPGGRHLRVPPAPGAPLKCELWDGPPEHFCRPAADVMFRSVAEATHGAAIGVILTGMGRDGALGLGRLKQLGAYVIGQDEESCTVYGMPRAAKAAGAVDAELPLDQIAGELQRLARGGRVR